ncbi:AI-2E family transporter [Bacillus salitolerans]|uniref:AI-2E family transporter n=1 Tax=Bacillus salitolerans TaxID=1437434 RepID=A0ABW4LPS7_9BACI
MKKSHINWILRLVILLLIFLCLFMFKKIELYWAPFYKAVLAIFIPFLIASFITYLLHPLIEKLHGHNIPRPIAILVIYLLFFGGLGFALYKGVPQIIFQIREFTNNVPNLFEQYREWSLVIHSQTEQFPEGLHARIEEGLQNIEEGLGSLLTLLVEGIKSLLNYIIILALIPFLVFYMLKDYNLMKRSLWYVTPRRWRKPGVRFLRDIDQSLGNYIRGQLLVCLVIGVLASVGLWMIGMKYPLLLGTIIGITNIIPYFGPIFGAVPALLISVTISGKMVIWVTVLIFSLQFIEGNLLSPIIVGKSLHMHPVIIMFALLVGGELGGIIGLIVAVPLLAIIKVTILHAKVHFSRH